MLMDCAVTHNALLSDLFPSGLKLRLYETYQEIGSKTFPLDEREVVRSLL